MPRSAFQSCLEGTQKESFKNGERLLGPSQECFNSSKNAVDKALQYAYVGRKDKKPMYRQIWIVRINAAVRPHGMTYSTFMHKLKLNNIDINRKVLADLAANNPEAFDAIVNQVK